MFVCSTQQLSAKGCGFLAKRMAGCGRTSPISEGIQDVRSWAHSCLVRRTTRYPRNDPIQTSSRILK